MNAPHRFTAGAPNPTRAHALLRAAHALPVWRTLCPRAGHALPREGRTHIPRAAHAHTGARRTKARRSVWRPTVKTATPRSIKGLSMTSSSVFSANPITAASRAAFSGAFEAIPRMG